MRTLRGFAAEERGQIIVLGGIMFMTLLFAVGLAIDAGQLYVAKRTQQEASDAAAFAGAIVIYQGGVNPPLATTVTAAKQAAKDDATRNGYTDDAGIGITVVTVNSPPTSGTYNNNANYVEVIITRQVRTALVPAQSVLNPVKARGVAGAEPLNNGYAVMALNRGNTPSAFTDGPSANIHLTGGGILVNSTSPTAAVNSQTTCANFTISAGSVNIAGGSASSWPAGCIPAFPPVNTAAPQQPDPFAGFPKPSIAGLPVCTTFADPGCQDAAVPPNQNPGIYKLPLGGSGLTVMNLNTGIYILEQGITETGNTNVNSNVGGVFLFNTTTTYPNPGGTCASVTLAGNGAANLAAMTTGTYANFLLYQDPACTAGVTIKGNGTFTGSGTFYVPNASFTFSGNNATLTGSQLVANTVNVQNGNLNINYNGGTTAQPILPRLAE